MLSNTIRSNFLKFFNNRHHQIVPSSPVFPHNDPSILFTNAGMNQFKDIFLGKENAPYNKATTSQKCIRAGGKHNDLDNVGHTSRHLTFFEMLGNFSFGDYFKNEAIAFAWEVSLSVFNFDPDFLYATVHEKDDEAFALWEKYLPHHKIVRLGDKDNFWSMADTGPCGFCSELLFDRGPSFGSSSSPLEDFTGERFLEYWNLVFMEFNRSSDGHDLPLTKKNIDTGAGLERLISLLSGSTTVFESDVLKHLIIKIENVSKQKYNPETPLGAAFRVIADHIRALSFSIADGLLPSNTDRGYVLRKILRRAVNYGKHLNFTEPFLGFIVPALVEAMGEAYPNLKTSQSQITEVLSLEEESFFKTLKRGGNLLQQVLLQSSSSNTISGNDAFKLKDTYGLPIEEITLLAKDNGFQVDLDTYSNLEQEARLRSKQQSSKSKVDLELFDGLDVLDNMVTDFIGYDTFANDSFIELMIQDGSIVDHFKEGSEGIIILKDTPFYAEKGGQVGDQGYIFSTLFSFNVTKTTVIKQGVILHHGLVTQGEIRSGSAVTAQINIQRRNKISNNHTACHLLHKSLEIVLGEHIKQAGSYVDETKIRLDFTHAKPILRDELDQIEDLVNQQIRENANVETQEIAYTDVVNNSEIKQFFGDKYGDYVRVVSSGFTKELCGGTHTSQTGNIGYFRVVKEGTISTGIRRIEAVSGKAAELIARKDQKTIFSIGTILNSPLDNIETKALNCLQLNKQLKDEINLLESKLISNHISQLSSSIDQNQNISLLIYQLDTNDAHLLQKYATILHSQYPHDFISISSVKKDDKYVILVKISENLTKSGLFANLLLQNILEPISSGKWGGKPQQAQGSSTIFPSKSELKLIVNQWISTQLK